MSSYRSKAENPLTGKVENAEFLDDYYGKHQYGVRFKDGHIYPVNQIKIKPDGTEGGE